MDINKIKATDVQQWIQEHKHFDISKLSFQKSPFVDVSMKDLIQQLQGYQLASKKFPELFESKGILFPPKLNLEQTSSTSTAEYKSKLMKGKTLIDITGGLGIDDLYFSKQFESVIHIEKDKDLQELAAQNFSILNKKNIESYNQDGICFLNEHTSYKDVLYVDPGRRNLNQQKVFLLKDLSPNILDYLDEWTNRFNEVWVKLSPMIDLQYLIKTIPLLSQIHLVAVMNDLKEVLIQIKKHPLKQLTAVNLESQEPEFINHWTRELPDLIYSNYQKFIYEPNVAVQKSGFINALAHNLQLNKLHPNTQLLTSGELISSFPGRIYKVNSVIKNPKKVLKGKSVMAIHRNFPESLSNLRKRYKFKTDGIEPIIFTQSNEQVLILSADLM